jgi:hypothetical protein
MSMCCLSQLMSGAHRGLGRALVPPGHADGDAVALGGHRHVLARAGAGQLEGVVQQPLAAQPGEHRLLQHELALGAAEHHAAHRAVLALGVLAHDQHVDVAGLAPGQRAGHAVEQPRRAQVDVLVELAAELQQAAPQRHMVGHGGRPAHGAEQDGVHAADLRLPVVGHHLAGALRTSRSWPSRWA